MVSWHELDVEGVHEDSEEKDKPLDEEDAGDVLRQGRMVDVYDGGGGGAKARGV